MVADGNLREAETLVREYLRRIPDDIEAMRVLAMIAHQQEFSRDAEVLLEAVLEKAPDYHPARYEYALALFALHKHAKAREQMERLIAAEPGNPAHRITLASILSRPRARLDDAIALYRRNSRRRCRRTRNCTCRLGMR